MQQTSVGQPKKGLQILGHQVLTGDWLPILCARLRTWEDEEKKLMNA